ncbi:MAG: hypothetical protein JWN04_5786, partial [Myxococcaceae bacterium]|nr:hypothetical protein [Myxococcaceae bacterium]
ARTQTLLDQFAKVGSTDGTGDIQPDPTDPAATKLAHQQSQYDHTSSLRWIGVGSGVLGTAASALLVRPRGTIPWWGYAFAAAGVGLVVAGGVEVAASSGCDLIYNTQCRRPHDSAARGALLLSAAAPFLSVPILQLIKPNHARALSLSPAASYGGLQLQLRASY